MFPRATRPARSTVSASSRCMKRVAASAVALVVSSGMVLSGCAAFVPVGTVEPTASPSEPAPEPDPLPAPDPNPAPPPAPIPEPAPEPVPDPPPNPAPEPNPPGAALDEQICDLAYTAWSKSTVDEISGEVAMIRELNLIRGEGDGLYWQVWQLADMWDGYIHLLDEPDLNDGGAGVVAAMHNLVDYCDAYVV